MLENLEKLGIKNIELTVEVDNERAQRLYRNLGFEVVEELENEYRDNSRRYLMGVYLEK